MNCMEDLPLVCGLARMYSFNASFCCSTCCSGTTPRTTATPLFLNAELNASGAWSRSVNSISGMTLLPSSTMSGISSRRWRSSRSHDSRTAPSWPRIRRPLRSAYSADRGSNSCPESDAKASEMLPGRFCACVAAVRRGVTARLGMVVRNAGVNMVEPWFCYGNQHRPRG